MNFLANLSALTQNTGQAQYAADPDFLAQFPLFVTSGEDRILRDLDLLTTHITDDSGILDATRRRFMLPTDLGAFIVLDSIRVVVGGVTMPALDWISKEAMNVVYPSDGAVGVPSIPRYVCPLDQESVLLGPAPGAAYRVFCDGTQYPASLNTGATINPDQTISIAAGSPAFLGTYISNNIPDVFIAAQMITVSAWMRQFSAMSDDPQQARNWTEEYERLKSGELATEMRKRLASQGWGSRLPNPIATPPTPTPRQT